MECKELTRLDPNVNSVIRVIKKILCGHRDLVSAMLIGSSVQNHAPTNTNIDIDVILLFKDINASVIDSLLETRRVLKRKYQTSKVAVIVNTQEVTVLRPSIFKNKQCLLYVHLTPLSLKEFEGFPKHVKFSIKCGKVICGASDILREVTAPELSDIIDKPYGIKEFIEQIKNKEILIGKRLKEREIDSYSLVFEKRRLEGYDYLYYIIYGVLKASWNALSLRFSKCWQMPEGERYKLFESEFSDFPYLDFINRILAIRRDLLEGRINASEVLMGDLAERAVKFLRTLCEYLNKYGANNV